MNSLYTQLSTSLPGFEKNTAHGMEFHTTCPRCFTAPKKGHVHFSISERGGFCFVCEFRALLPRLGRMLLGEAAELAPYSPPPPRPPKARPAWLRRGADLVARYVAHGGAARAWADYKPLPEGIRLGYRLGYGVLPSSRCKMARLIVPLLSSGAVVGLRGRGVRGLPCANYSGGECLSMFAENFHCAKWLQAAGSSLVLYNGARLLPPGSRGKAAELQLGDTVGDRVAENEVLFIVENPVDSLLVEAVSGAVAVATLSVTMWRDAWTLAVTAARCLRVYVAYDNDVPGNGNTPAAWAAWRESGHRDIIPNGQRLVKRLRAAGVPALLWSWEGYPVKADIGGALL